MTEQVQNYDLITAFTSMYKKYAIFSGRSRRSEYWLAHLAMWLISMIFSFIINGLSVGYWVTLMAESSIAGLFLCAEIILSIIQALYAISIFIPSLALTVRRFHDSGKSGLLLLLRIIPWAGTAVCSAILVFIVFSSNILSDISWRFALAFERYGLSFNMLKYLLSNPEMALISKPLVLISVFYLFSIALEIIFFIFTLKFF